MTSPAPVMPSPLSGSNPAWMVVLVLGALFLLAPIAARAQTAPSATADEYALDEDETLIVTAPGVLENDSDADGDPLSAVLVGDVSNGTLDLRSDGSFDYTPNPGFFGTDTFTYRASDGTETSTETTVTLSVNARPDASPDSYSVQPNTTLIVDAPGVLGNDTDPNGNDTIALLDTGPTNGTLEPRGSDLLQLTLDGAFTYTPDTDFSGTDSFTYVAEDRPGARSDTVTVTIIVNSPPTATDDAYEMSESDTLDVNFSGNNVLANDSDPEGDVLDATLVTNPSNGTLIPQGSDNLSLTLDGDFAYTPNSGFVGTDTFTYRADDGVTDDTATVSITVYPRPTAAPDAYAMAEGNTLSVDAPGILANDTDEVGEGLSAFYVSGPSNGTLTPQGADNLNIAQDGAFGYTPDAGFSGTDSFRYQVSDGVGGQDTTTVTISVNGPPVAQDDAYQVSEGDTLTYLANASVLANDSDPDGDALDALLVSEPANGELLPLGSDNLLLTLDGDFTYVPNSEFVGVDTFRYLADDGSSTDTATVAITVNGRPTAVPDAYTVAVNETLEVAPPGVLRNDTDPEGDDLFARMWLKDHPTAYLSHRAVITSRYRMAGLPTFQIPTFPGPTPSRIPSVMRNLAGIRRL